MAEGVCDALGLSLLSFVKACSSYLSIDFHIVPGDDACLSFCLHIIDKADKYSILLGFLDKFKTLNRGHK